MDNNTLRMITENHISSLEGNDFQDFCDRLCLVLHPDDYTPVRAGGPKGDMKNDGYCPKARIFFQAHATRGETIAKSKAKILADLSGCLSKHSQVKSWIYLTNDTLVGEIETYVDELRPQHVTVTIETWGHKRIADQVMRLERPQIEMVLGMSLSLTDFEIEEQIDKYESSVVDTIFRQVLSDLEEGGGKAYEYEDNIKIQEKIKLNFTDKSHQELVSGYFRYAYTKHRLIQGRVQSESPEVQNDLHSDIFEKYTKLKSAKSSIELLDALIEIYVPQEYVNNETYKNLAKAYVLFFFEDCTIFERAGNQ